MPGQRWKLTGPEIPSLYGIRGISAAAVVLWHLQVPAANGPYAVVCFFVLSGFLITHLLLKEHDAFGGVSLRRFYARRSLRIFPAFYVYSAVYVAGALATGKQLDWPQLAACLTYLGNYFPAWSGAEPTLMTHTWSLAVEEQFYLLWPLLFRTLAPKPARLGKALAGIVIAIWIFRALVMALGAPRVYVYYVFETRADALAVGCLLAVALHQNALPQWLIERRWVGLAAVAAIVALCAWAPELSAGSGIGFALAPLAFAVLIVQAVRHSESRWYAWLNSAPLRGLGLISYSMYLYHTLSDNLPAQVKYLPVQLAFVLVAAAGSYLLVERPMLRWKDRFRGAGRAARVRAAGVQ